MNLERHKAEDVPPPAHLLYGDKNVSILASDLMRLRLLGQVSPNLSYLYIQHLCDRAPSTFLKRVMTMAEFRMLQWQHKRRESLDWWRGMVDPSLLDSSFLWFFGTRGCSLILIRQTETHWLLLGVGDKKTLRSAMMTIEDLVRDFYPGEAVEIRVITVQPKDADASVISLFAARVLLMDLRSLMDLEQLSFFAPTVGNVQELFEEVEGVLIHVGQIQRQELDRVMEEAERYMAKMYLQTSLDSSPSGASRLSSLRTSMEACSQSFLENPHIRTSTDVTIRRLSASSSSEQSGTPGSRMEDASHFKPPVLVTPRDSIEDEEEESVPSEQDVINLTSPQAASTGPVISWTSIPPGNRVPDTEIPEGTRETTESSDSKSELIYIEYRYQSPRSLHFSPIQMAEISEDVEEEARTQVDPCILDALSCYEYEEALSSTTPKFRTAPITLDLEGTKSRRPPSFSSCDFAKLMLESPTPLAQPVCSSPRNRYTNESEGTLDPVSEEPEPRFLPRSLVARMSTVSYVDFLEGGVQSKDTCGVGCALL